MDFILSTILQIILIPIIALIATPFLIVASFFGKNSYFNNFKSGIRSVLKFWDKFGIHLIPQWAVPSQEPYPPTNPHQGLI